jgi:hypothetical protein
MVRANLHSLEMAHKIEKKKKKKKKKKGKDFV